MKKILYLAICIFALLVTACDVHEWPETPEYAQLHLRLDYETQMTEWRHLYNGNSVIDQSVGDTYENHYNHGKIRYIVRTYPVNEKKRSASNHIQEFVITRDIADGYDYEVTLKLWCALFLDENIRGIIFIHRWKGKRWTTKGFIK